MYYSMILIMLTLYDGAGVPMLRSWNYICSIKNKMEQDKTLYTAAEKEGKVYHAVVFTTFCLFPASLPCVIIFLCSIGLLVLDRQLTVHIFPGLTGKAWQAGFSHACCCCLVLLTYSSLWFSLSASLLPYPASFSPFSCC